MRLNLSVRSERGQLMVSVASRALNFVPAALVVGVTLAGAAQAGTVNPVQDTTYNLTPANNPITFGAGTNIGAPGQNAVYGDASTPWDVTNGGTLSGQNGVRFESSSTVTNVGHITGSNYGILLDASGTVANQSGAVIYGNDIGVAVSGGPGAGNVTNSGTIGGYTGVRLKAGGSITNGATGKISGVFTGVYASGAAATVTNAGNITSETNGVLLAAGGTVANQSGAVIYGFSIGVAVSGGPGTVTNSGQIIANSSLGGAGVSMSEGTVTNTSTGSITGTGYGLVVLHGAGNVTNSGTISGGLSTGVRLQAGGSITNNATGKISGLYSGVYASGAAATVTNAGSISAPGNDLQPELLPAGVDLAGGGSVTNAAGGTITSNGYGVVIHGGSVVNAGKIAGYGQFNIEGPTYVYGGVGVEAISNATIVNQAGGEISGASWGVDAEGDAAITNAGEITSVQLHAGGSVVNEAGGTIGVLVSGGPVSVTNAGTITFGLLVSGGPASITNAGTITSADGDGVVAESDASVDNQAGGTISGTSEGLVISGGGTVTNAGTISGKLASVLFEGAGANTLTLQTGSVLTGNVIGSTDLHASNALVLQGSGEADNAFLNFGTLTAQGPGIWKLGGTSTIGSTEVAGGALVVSGALTSTFTIDQDATLQGGTSNLLAQGTVIDNGTLVFSQPANAAFTNNVVGSGAMVKQGVGLLALDGVSSVASTTVNAGNLQVGDAAHTGAKLTSAVTVNTGATLSGHGSVVGAVANNGGTVSPGGSIGVLTINGDYTQTSTGALAIDATPTDSSVLRVTGTAHLAGTLAFDAGPGVYRKGQQYDFLTAGAITGSFATIDIVGPANFSISQEGDSFIATATAGNFALSGGATANQRAIVPAFNDYPVGVSDFDPVATAIINLGPGPAQNLAVNELGSEIGPNLVSASRDSVRSLLGGLTVQLGARPASGASSTHPVWMQAIGQFGSTTSDGNAHGYSDSAAGFAGGVQRDFGSGTAGATVSYDQTWVSLSGLPQSGNVGDVSLGLYGEERFDTVYADLGGLVGFDHGSEKRLIAAPGVSRRASGSFDGMSGGVIGVLGDRIAMSGGWTVEPRVGFDWSHVDQNGYTESGAGGADLAVVAAHQDAVQSLLGARVTKAFGDSFSGEASLDWAHDFDDLTPRGAQSFAAAPGTGFTIAGVNPGRDAAIVGAGLNYQASRVTFYARYDGSFSNRTDDHVFSGGLRIAF